MQVASNFVQSRVARTVWPWPVARTPPPAAASCRRRAVIQFFVMLAVAGLVALKYRHIGFTLLCVALFVIVTGLAAPRVFLALERGFREFGRWVGLALTWALLVPFFFLVFVPGRVVLLLSRKDPLQRAFPGDGQTSWVPHQTHRGNTHYTKQYR
jgi:hypothetical protein